LSYDDYLTGCVIAILFLIVIAYRFTNPPDPKG
jgi:hypothetical protein